MDTPKIEIKAHKLKNVLVDVTVEADLSNMLWRPYCGYKDKLELAKDLERAVKGFHDFLRDHRSHDMVQLNVKRIHKDLCSACQAQWEPDEENGKLFCANCGAEILNDRAMSKPKSYKVLQMYFIQNEA